MSKLPYPRRSKVHPEPARRVVHDGDVPVVPGEDDGVVVEPRERAAFDPRADGAVQVQRGAHV